MPNLCFEGGVFRWGERLATAIEIAAQINELNPVPKIQGNTVTISHSRLQIKLRLFGSFPLGIAIEKVVRYRGEWLPANTISDYVVFGHRLYPISEIPEIVGYNLRFGTGPSNPVTASEYLKMLALDELQDWLVNDVEDAVLDRSNVDIQRVAIPDSLNADLSPYQFVGFAFLKILADAGLGALLADEMGLGKTLQAIALILSMNEAERILVVAPSSLIGNWRRELDKFAPTSEPYFHSGSHRTRSPKRFALSRLVVTSYELLVNDFGLIGDLEWDLVVLDEAQYIRNPSATRAQRVKELTRRVSIAITGTPVENRLDDLRSIADFVLPHYLPRFEMSGEKVSDELSQSRALGQIMSAITIRRDVSDVAKDLPERIDSFVALEPSKHLEHRATALGIDLKVGIKAQILSSHAEDADEYGQSSFTGSAKWDYLASRLEEIAERGEKALVFFTYIASIERASAAIRSSFPSLWLGVITGSVVIEDRMAIIDHFSEVEGPSALLLQVDAAGTGLNITTANHVFFFCPHWNPAVTAQAAARAFRRGQKKPVFVHHLYYQNTVEEEQISRAEYKRQIAAEVRGGMS